MKTEKKGRDNLYIINPFLIYNRARILKKIYKMFEDSKFNLK